MIKDNVESFFNFINLYLKFGNLITNFNQSTKFFYEKVYGTTSLQNMDEVKELATFKAEASNILDIVKLVNSESSSNSQDISSILVSPRRKCRICMKTLTIKNDYKIITIYDDVNGTTLGRRYVKTCNSCKISEHYGYYVKDKKRVYDLDQFISNKMFISTEDTCITKSMLKRYSIELLIACLPFQTKAKCYNVYFNYKKLSNTDIVGSKRKRSEAENCREVLDRRRFEEAFILYSVLHECVAYKLPLQICAINRNNLLKDFIDIYYPAFLQKWTNHICDVSGCENVIVIDGNMKNCRQVCAVKDVTSCTFRSISGLIKTGCINTPQQGHKLCEEHVKSACTYRNDCDIDGTLLESNKDPINKNENDILCIVKICSTRSTRSNTFYEVLWSNGLQSWLREDNIPVNILQNLKSSDNQLTFSNETFLGQHKLIKRLVPITSSEENYKENKIDESVGFAFSSAEDILVANENGQHQTLKCGTEKSKHHAKNRKTAGILAFVKPCGIVIDVKEIFGSESKSQVYGHLHDLLSLKQFNDIDCICYDDACHLMKYAINKNRATLTKTAMKISEMDFAVDKFHFPNHVDKWCKRMCNPYNNNKLKKVNTEACEQLFAWFSNYSKMTKHMNRYRFLYFILYLLDNHNELQFKDSL